MRVDTYYSRKMKGTVIKRLNKALPILQSFFRLLINYLPIKATLPLLA